MFDLNLIHASLMQTNCNEYPSSETVWPSNVGKGLDEVRFKQVLVICNLHSVNLSVIHSGDIDWLHVDLVADVVAVEGTFIHLLTLVA